MVKDTKPGKKRVYRRDFTLAPPPWPVGGGQLSEKTDLGHKSGEKGRQQGGGGGGEGGGGGDGGAGGAGGKKRRRDKRMKDTDIMEFTSGFKSMW